MNSDVECYMLLFKFQYKAEPQDISVLLQEKNLIKVSNKTDYNKKQNKQINNPPHHNWTTHSQNI